ncbi:MAG: hypothetical protein ACK5JQ_06475 [Bacteroidota bacterium]|jgi:hypothetical protein
MKKIITLCAVILLSAGVFAQSPNKMSYQAVIRNASNVLVTNQAIGMRISILQTSPSGTAVYVETQSTTTNSNGLVSVEIGGGTAVTGSFTSINWANGPYFIKTETDPAGGANYTITGTSQLLSVPYALYAANAGTASGGGNFTHYIGEEFGGGVIFHLWKDAQGMEHGLIVDKTDLSTSQAWSNVTNALIGISAQSSWDGLSNSNAIVSQPGHTNSAAALCLNSNNEGQSDWYLPSLDEITILWHNRFNVNKTLSMIGGAQILVNSATVWCSTEYDSNVSWYWNSRNMGASGSPDQKSDAHFVRAIRSF